MQESQSQSPFDHRDLRRELQVFGERLSATHVRQGHQMGHAIVEAPPVDDATWTPKEFRRILPVIKDWTNNLQGELKSGCNNPPRMDVLCAFGAVSDRTCNLDLDNPGELNDLLTWVDKETTRWESDVPSPNPTSAAQHPEDILFALSCVMPYEGDKTEVVSVELRRRMAGGFPAGPSVLGGAAAVISDVLNNLGVKSCFYSPYHSKATARLCSRKARWLDLNRDDNLEPVSAAEEGVDGHPTRLGFAVSYREGTYSLLTRSGAAPVVAQKGDRHLFVLKPPRGARSWSAVGHDIKITGLDDDEWPTLPGFVQWKVVAGTLEAAPASTETLRCLGDRYSYVIVTTPQPKDKPPATLQKQFSELRTGTFRPLFHLEISSKAAPSDDIAPFAEFSRDMLDSVGVNSEELPSYFNLLAGSREESKREAAPPVARFKQALALAHRLSVERLYVHGNDIDIILRRGGSIDALRREWRGDLFAKGAVLIATVLRNDHGADLLGIPDRFPTKAWLKLNELTSYLQSDDVMSRRYRWARSVSEVIFEARDANDYSVAIVPCIWVDPPPPRFSTTGAGDITSGVSLVYSGFRTARQAGA